jgi:hypothetical protein
LLSRAFSLAVRPPTRYDLRAMSDEEFEWAAEDDDPLLQLMQVSGRVLSCTGRASV